MTDLVAALTTAVLAGLLGSAHCLGMCGGISGLFAMHSSVRGLRRQLPMALTYNGGRLVSYMILGSAVAALGSRIAGLTPAAAGPVRLVAGAVIILIGLQVAFNIRALAFLERVGGIAWSRISPLAGRLLPVNSLPRALGLGLLWGLLPCGLVYSVLLVAATSARAVDGAFIMLAFGIGTTPAMVLTGLGAARLAQLMQDRRTRLGAGLLIVMLGILTLYMPITALMSPGPHSHH
ncbi:MAG: sulfite exporter TauE/SafE family protein [Gammaproteobacteria bacterium]|jgi:sulfite exporter TauE/SafE|nr:sulfite exporter TauE/SafE family protein [Gammaproteobacteria bacterium]MDH3953868.1 sulfite exporter TauE/SafE family protein [Gammaproteobacteria bacterium]MDH4003535.1 sulfite exporter TauE/SafE family protein [Gammaproteobacteria bacterium]NCF60674.1 sulfite exporter TauE/SafE family protein [Gammaproteobacteria bacterium]